VGRMLAKMPQLLGCFSNVQLEGNSKFVYVRGRAEYVGRKVNEFGRVPGHKNEFWRV
jgi:hypothetical protein